MRRCITVIALVMTSLFLTVSSASAGRGGSSISLVVLPPAAATASTTSQSPSYGGQVTFSASTDVANPFVNLDCYQNGAWVYDEWHGFWAGAMGGQTFTLSSLVWQGGDADCTARLVAWGSNGKQRTLASTSFHVDA